MRYGENSNSTSDSWSTRLEENQHQDASVRNQSNSKWQHDKFEPNDNRVQHNRNRNSYNRKPITIDDVVPTSVRKTAKSNPTPSPTKNNSPPVDTSHIGTSEATPLPVANKITEISPELSHVASFKSTPSPRQSNKNTRAILIDDIVPIRHPKPSTSESKQSTNTISKGLQKWQNYATGQPAHNVVSPTSQHSNERNTTDQQSGTENNQSSTGGNSSLPSSNDDKSVNQWSKYAEENTRLYENKHPPRDVKQADPSFVSGTMSSRWATSKPQKTEVPLSNQRLKPSTSTSSSSSYGSTYSQKPLPSKNWCENNDIMKRLNQEKVKEPVSPWSHFKSTADNDNSSVEENQIEEENSATNPSENSNHQQGQTVGVSDTPYDNNWSGNGTQTHAKPTNNETASSGWKNVAVQNGNKTSQESYRYLHPDDRNNYNRRLLFKPFMEPIRMEKGVKEGRLFQGILRVTKSRQDAYVVSEELDHDIYIGGMMDRNRALTGDLVAVEMVDVDQAWELKKERDVKRREDRKRTEVPEEEDKKEIVHDDENESDEEEHKPKYCGRVVGILMRPENRTYAGTIHVERSTKPREESENQSQERPRELRVAWFKPSDKKSPLIALRNHDIPRDLLDNESYYSSHLFAVKIIRWQITDLNPAGRIVNELGPIGDLMTEKIAILADNSINDSAFSPHALECLPFTPWAIPEIEYQKRRDLRSARVFSIDPATAKDLDDALHIKELDNGLFEVGVHIADVSYFLKRTTVLDSEARERGTSTYLVDSVIPMLPPLLCEELCSLNPGVERLAFSVIWKMDKHGNAMDTWFGKTIIKSCAKLAYEDAQDVIEGRIPQSGIEVFNDEEPFYVYSDIIRLYKLSKEMRQRRYKNGCLSLHSVKLNFKLDNEGFPVSVSQFVAKEANRLIEEFMLFANISVAQKICQMFPDTSLLRRHQEPIEKRLDEFIKITDVLGLNFNGNSAGELQQSFNNLKNQTVKDVMLILAIRCMQKAKYFCSGSLDISKFKHYALSEEIYTHFTSPIRRYADVIVHRLLEATLEYEQDPSKPKVPPYTKRLVQKIAFDCNTKKNGAKNAQDENILLYLAKYLDRMEQESGPVYKKATVIVVGKQGYDVYLPEYGLEKHIHLDSLPIEKFEFDKNTLAFDIYWKRGVPVTMHNEEKIYAQRTEDYSDDEEETKEFGEVEDSLAALTLQEPKEYNQTVNEDDLIPPTMIDEDQCKQTLKMFSVIDVRVQVNMERSPPFINLYPVNPFSGEQAH